MRGSSEVSADRIADLGALAGEHQARAMQLQHALLLRRLHPDEAHRRTGGLTFIPVDGAEQCANLGGLDDRGVVLHLRRNEGAMQVDTTSLCARPVAIAYRMMLPQVLRRRRAASYLPRTSTV